jgi:mannose-6-phosphate isomerase-like protein (cupin superfamily)
MTRLILLLFFIPFAGKAQFSIGLDTIKPPASFDNIHSSVLASDSLSSSFLLFIKKDVKKHKHMTHSEHVYVISGEGVMVLGEQNIKVRKGDMIFIPKGVVHALKVTSKEPMKVVSIQSPKFDGSDRIFIE